MTATSDTVYQMSADWSEMIALEGKTFIATTEHPSRSWFDDYIPVHEQSRVRAAITTAIANCQMFELEHQVLRVDGSLGWTFSRAIPLLDSAGALTGWFGAASDITPRKEAEAALRANEARLLAAIEVAERASRVKDEFLATLSHELRTPLSAIFLWAKLVGLSDDLGQIAEGIAAITQSAEVQKQLIDDLLDTARITTGKLRLDLQPTDLGSVVGLAIASIRPTAEAKGLTLVVSIAADVGPIIADAERIQQVVWNLLSNAVKFTPEDGRITVEMFRTEGRVHIRVSDTGCGIEAGFLPHLFERFRQQDNSTTRRASGLGLGLAIVRELVDMHNGTVVAESAGEGCGATLLVTLPRLRQAIHGRLDAVALGVAVDSFS